MDLPSMGRVIVGVGIALLVVGVLLMVVGRVPGMRQFGNLPGDVRIESGNFSCFVPIVSMLILSILLSLALNIILRLFNR